jgi:hypothetical protein
MGEIVAGIGGILLFAFLFFDWFSSGNPFGGSGIDGWDGLGGDFTGFIVALTCVAGPALAALALAGQRVNIPLPRGAVTAVLGSLSVLIILWRFFANPGDLKVGIFLGLAAAVAVAVGAVMALREDGFELLVAVPGGRTRVAAASAPPAKPSRPPAAATKTKGSTSKKSAARSGGAKRSSGSTRSRSKGSSASKSGSTRSRAKSGGSKSTSTRSRSTKAKATKSTRSTTAKKPKAPRSRSSGSKRSSGTGKK